MNKIYAFCILTWVGGEQSYTSGQFDTCDKVGNGFTDVVLDRLCEHYSLDRSKSVLISLAKIN